MNVVVIGAGAVGGYFGGKMARKGIPVTFLVREKRYRQLQEQGLVVKSIHGDFTIRPHLALSAKEIEKPELVLLAMKNYHFEDALPQIAELVNRGAKVLPLLNGVRHIDVLVERFGPEAVLGGLCYIESTLNEAGEVVQTSPMQDITFGALAPVNETWLQELEASFRLSEITVQRSDSILVDMWKKYMFLVSLSGITAAIRNPIGVALNDNVTSAFIQEMIEEVLHVARARQIPLPDDIADQTLQRLYKIEPTMTSSMHRDLVKGLPLELDSLHGYLLEMAVEYNIATPCIRAVYALLHPYAEGIK